MWLLSFAWRNRNLKQKPKGKREGRVKRGVSERENKCHPTLQSITLPSVHASLTRTTSIYAWKTLPGQLLIKVHLQEKRNNPIPSTIWELLAGLYNTPMQLPFCTWYAPCMLLTPLWSCSQGYGAMIILPLANHLLRLWTVCCRLQEPRSYGRCTVQATPTNRSPDPILIQLVNA